MKAVFFATLLVAPHLAYVPQALASPGAIYRCGNDYLNDVAQAQARGCSAVESSGLRVTVPGTRVQLQVAEPMATPAQTQTQARPATGPAPASLSTVSSNAAPKTTSWRTDSAEQRGRDRDALSILQAELAKAEAKLAERQRDLIDPQRPASGLSELQASISRHLSDIAGLKREISRLPLHSTVQSK